MAKIKTKGIPDQNKDLAQFSIPQNSPPQLPIEPRQESNSHMDHAIGKVLESSKDLIDQLADPATDLSKLDITNGTALENKVVRIDSQGDHNFEGDKERRMKNFQIQINEDGKGAAKAKRTTVATVIVEQSLLDPNRTDINQQEFRDLLTKAFSTSLNSDKNDKVKVVPEDPAKKNNQSKEQENSQQAGTSKGKQKQKGQKQKTPR